MKLSLRSSLISRTAVLFTPQQSCLQPLPPLHERTTPTNNRPALFNTTLPAYESQKRHFSITPQTRRDAHISPTDIDEHVTKEEQDHYDKQIAADKEKQVRTPWHREGIDKPPVDTNRSAGAMTKGKLLTTPTRLFKLVLPLTVRDHNGSQKDSEPLALLVHPSQPLSYLERLIQSELPLLEKDGKERIPTINFLAVDSLRDDIPPGAKGSATKISSANDSIMRDDSTKDKSPKQKKEREDDDKNDEKNEQAALDKADGKEDPSHTHLHTSNSHSPATASALRGAPGEGGVESYSGLGREAPPSSSSSSNHTPTPTSSSNNNSASTDEETSESQPFVRWSKSTEIGDFVRDAARGREFAVEIEGAPRDIRVGVPSFGDRTYYLRMRLRKRAREIAGMADVKRECDLAAEAGAQRVAYAGFGGMVGWLAVVWYLTFLTDLGWDVMEPITYLVGLGGILVGYGYFLFNKREASYRSAMNITVSRRQNKLYEERGFDLRKWEYMMEEANALRKEIIAVANEYDVEWDERRDARDEKVIKALKEHRRAKGKGKKEGEDEKEEEEEEEEGEGQRGKD